MDAQELRIGDFIYFECENLHMTTVGEILSINTNLDRFKSGDDKGKFIYTVNMKDQWGNIRNEEQLIDIEPIPLTEEWLLRFGFDDSEYKEGYTGVDYKTNLIMDFVLTKPNFMGEWQNYYTYDLGQHRFVALHYVHELQNLFFAVTTTELELKTDV